MEVKLGTAHCTVWHTCPHILSIFRDEFFSAVISRTMRVPELERNPKIIM